MGERTGIAPGTGGAVRRNLRRQAGFTYLGVLILIALMGTLLAVTGEVWSTVQQRQKEQDLLFIGHQFREAIRLYYDRSPGGAKRYPRKLEDLLQDDRYPTTQRYLRKIYFDPLTGKQEWGLLKAPDEGIAGVYSLAPGTPLKVDNFDEKDAAFKGARRYSRWQFSYQLVRPGAPNGQPVADKNTSPASDDSATPEGLEEEEESTTKQ